MGDEKVLEGYKSGEERPEKECANGSRSVSRRLYLWAKRQL